jgi:hypothetical protein
MNKVLKRIIALPTIPQDETFEIKNRASEILKSWATHLEEITEMQKKDAKRGSSSDTEKSPVKSPNDNDNALKDDNAPKDNDVPKDNDTPKDDQTPKQDDETNEDVDTNPEAVSKLDEEGNDFVVVEGGGEADELAQEKAAKTDKDTEASAAEPMGI